MLDASKNKETFHGEELMYSSFSKKQLKKQLLVQTVLASSIFVAPMVYAKTSNTSTEILKKTSPDALSSCVINEVRYDHLKTSSCVNNTVSVAQAGQIINVDGVSSSHPISLDNDGGKIMIDPNNVHASKAVLVAYYNHPYQTPNAINITGKKGIVTIGKGSGVTSEQDSSQTHVIYINNGDVTINNAGVIKANPVSTSAGMNGGAIYMGSSGINATVNNFPGAEISNNWYASNAVITAGNGFSLINEGLIQSNANPMTTADALYLKDFKFVINSGRIISSTATAINIDGEKIGGSKEDIAIHNRSGGEIRAISGAAIEGGWAIMGAADGVPSILNQGIISSGFGTTIQSTELLGGLVNEGMIINEAGNTAIALNWITRSGRGSPFIQKKGEVQGHVYLSPADGYGRGKVFTLSGGIITGNVTAADFQPYTYELSGGELDGVLTGSTRGDTFNQSGSIIKIYQGHAIGGNKDTFNITGGSFKTLNTSAIGTTDVNFNANYTVDGTIVSKGSQLNINIDKAASVTANTPIFGLNGALTVSKESAFIPNSTITTGGTGRIDNQGLMKVSEPKTLFDLSSGGTFNNAGTLELGSSGILNIKAGAIDDVFKNEDGSYLNIEMTNSSHGQIIVDSTAKEAVLLSKGLFIKPLVAEKLTEKEFNIITVPNGSSIDDKGAVVLNPTDYFFKTKLINNNTVLQLVLDDGQDNCIVDRHKEALLQTSLCDKNRIAVISTGQIQNKDDQSEVLFLDSEKGQVIIDSGNTKYAARAVLATGTSSTKAIHITAENAFITIGEGSGLTAESTKNHSHAISVGGSATITNEGTIQLSGSVENIQANAIYIDKTASATVKNLSTGIVSNNENYNSPVIAASTNAVFKLENAGKILTPNYSYPTIDSDNAQLISIINTGEIKNEGGGEAINLSAAIKGELIQKGGEIIGHVLLAQTDSAGRGHVFTLEEGNISGDVIAADMGANTFTLTGGRLSGSLIGGNKGDSFNQSGGRIEFYEGSAGANNQDTFNITGGDFTALETSDDKDSYTEINFTPTNEYIVGKISGHGSQLSIHVGDGITKDIIVTANGDILGLNGVLTAHKESTFVPNSTITTEGIGRLVNEGIIKISNPEAVFDLSSGGTFSNARVFELGSRGILKIKGGATADVFTNEDGSYLNIEMNNNDYGNILVSGIKNNVVLKEGSFINLQVTGNPTDKTFDIITVDGGGNISDKSQLKQSGVPAGFIFKSELVENKILRLIMDTIQQDCIVKEHREGSLQTASCLDAKITITSTGQMQNQINDYKSEVLSLDSNDGQIIIDPDNTRYNAEAVLTTLNSTATPTIGIHVKEGGRNGIITIGKDSGVTSKSTVNKSHAIAVKALGTRINNEGTIQLSGSAENIQANAIYIDGISSATVNNLSTGIILNNENYNSPVIAAGTNAVFKLENAGKILTSNYSHPTIHSENAQLVSIINTGEIKNEGGGEAINLSAAIKGEFIQKGGEIIGHVLLAQTDSAGRGHVFTLEEGNISGDVIAADMGANTFTLTGGRLSGSLIGGNKGDSFNQSGGRIEFYEGSAGANNQDTFNITGGDFTALETSDDKDSYTEINFTPTNEYIVGKISGHGSQLSIHVGDGITKDIIVTANGDILGLNGVLTAHKESTFVPNATITTEGIGRIDNQGLIQVSKAVVFDLSAGTGVFSNAATLELGSSGVLNIKGSAEDIFKNEDGSYLKIKMTDSSHGQIKLNSTAKEAVLLSKFSFIKPLVSDSLLTKTEFDIITVVGGGTITDDNSQLDLSGVPEGTIFKKNLVDGNRTLQLIRDEIQDNCVINSHRESLLHTSRCPESKITVTETGQIQNKENQSDILLLDNHAGKIVIDPDNIPYGARAVLATFNSTGTPTIGIHITDQGDNGEVTIGAGSGISVESSIDRSHAIVVESSGTIISNEGSIQLSGSTANIQANAIYIAKDSGATVHNRGEISNNTNYVTPLIAVDLNADTFTLENTGIIESKGFGANASALQIDGDFIGIANQGTIQQSNANSLGVGIKFNNAFNNEGGTEGIIAIHNQADAMISVVGSGSAIDLGKFELYGPKEEGSLRNEGSILNVSGPTILSGDAKLYSGLINVGKITNKNNGTAIDLSQAVRGAFRQQEGEVKGDVFLAQGDGEGNGYVFILEDGTITGNVTAANTQSYTHELLGGKLNGTFTGGLKGDIFNQYASKVSTFQGNATVGYTDTFNIEGGSFSTIRTSTAGTTDVNFNDSYVGNGSIVASEGNKLNINVGSEDFVYTNLTLNNTISGLSGALTVYESNTFSPREKITTNGSGHIVNQGITRISKPIEFDFSSGGTFGNENTGELNLGKDILTIKAAAADAFIAEADSVIKFTIDTEKYGQINVETTYPGEAVLLKKNSFIQPSVINQDEMNTFDIITVSDPGRITDEGVEIINPEGFLFDKQLVNEGKTLQLTIQTTFFDQLAQLPTQSAVDKQMENLPDRNGLIQGAKQGMNEVFNVVSDRVFGVAQGSHRDEINQGGVWLRALGSHAVQGIREGISGYKAEGIGFALGTDFVYNDDNTLGFSVNYYKTNVDGENQFSAQDGNILNLQATLYGSIHFEHGIFLNGIVGGSANDYQSSRVIAVNDFAMVARGTFGGMQWGGQVDLGMAMIDSGDNFIAPFVSVKSMSLSFDHYTETGAGDLGLSVNNSHVSELMGGVGLKLSTVWQLGKLGYAPSLTALVGYDFANEQPSSTAQFIGGGPVFSAPGVTSAPMLFDFGVGLNVLSDKEMVFSVKYDMQMRDKFLINAGYVQYSYQWS